MTDDSVLPGASPQAGQDGLAPRCGRCRKRHLVGLACWRGHYAIRRRDDVFAAKGTLCWQCRREGRRTVARTVDHVLARSRGGTDELRNLEPACHRHNYGKGNRITSPYPDVPGAAGNGVPISGRFR